MNKPELEQHRQIWLTKEAYNYLRKQKRKQGLSMARILNDKLLEK